MWLDYDHPCYAPFLQCSTCHLVRCTRWHPFPPCSCLLPAEVRKPRIASKQAEVQSEEQYVSVTVNVQVQSEEHNVTVTGG